MKYFKKTHFKHTRTNYNSIYKVRKYKKLYMLQTKFNFKTNTKNHYLQLKILKTHKHYKYKKICSVKLKTNWILRKPHLYVLYFAVKTKWNAMVFKHIYIGN